jgi:drug/metabolite transporter (DMT)-like permease
MGAWLALAAALISTALAQVAYKRHFQRPAGGAGPVGPWGPGVAVAVVLFLGATVFAYLALRALPLGTVYMSTALTQVLVSILSWWVLDERLTGDHQVAMAFIVLGIVVYAA